MSESGTERSEEGLVARAYDKTDGEHIADIYTLEAAHECDNAWWIRVVYTDDPDDVCPECEEVMTLCVYTDQEHETHYRCDTAGCETQVVDV